MTTKEAEILIKTKLIHFQKLVRDNAVYNDNTDGLPENFRLWYHKVYSLYGNGNESYEYLKEIYQTGISHNYSFEVNEELYTVLISKMIIIVNDIIESLNSKEHTYACLFDDNDIDTIIKASFARVIAAQSSTNKDKVDIYENILKNFRRAITSVLRGSSYMMKDIILRLNTEEENENNEYKRPFDSIEELFKYCEYCGIDIDILAFNLDIDMDSVNNSIDNIYKAIYHTPDTGLFKCIPVPSSELIDTLSRVSRTVRYTNK